MAQVHRRCHLRFVAPRRSSVDPPKFSVTFDDMDRHTVGQNRKYEFNCRVGGPDCFGQCKANFAS
jgi:hypothetical protein